MTVLSVGPLRIADDGTASYDGQPLYLSPTEHRFLFAVARWDGDDAPHRWLLRTVWGAEPQAMHLSRQTAWRVRKRLPDPSVLVAHPRFGYRVARTERSEVAA